MGDFLYVKNWEQFQQYRDRDPKWIKLHRDTLDDYEFDGLTEIQQCHLIKIWLLAAKLGNKIPNDPKWIARKIGAQSKVDLDQLVTVGFLFVEKSVQPRTQTYTEGETEAEGEDSPNGECGSPDGKPPCPHQKIVDLYHETCPHLASVIKLTPARQQALRARWRNELTSMKHWETYFDTVAKSDFLSGRAPPRPGSDKPWSADFDWLIKQGNCVKVMEGKYD